MSSNGDTDCSDLVQTTRPSHKVQDLTDSLINYFSTKSILEEEGWSRVECSSTVLDKVKEAFKKDFLRSKKVVIEFLNRDHRLTK